MNRIREILEKVYRDGALSVKSISEGVDEKRWNYTKDSTMTEAEADLKQLFEDWVGENELVNLLNKYTRYARRCLL